MPTVLALGPDPQFVLLAAVRLHDPYAYLGAQRSAAPTAGACAPTTNPHARAGYRIGLPWPGAYDEIFNSDSHYCGGSGVGNCSRTQAEARAWKNRPYSASVTIPPLGAIILAPARG